MGKAKEVQKKSPKRTLPPAVSPEQRENQLISLAYNLVEERLLDGTASSAETTAILRLGTAKAQLEKEKLKQEVKLAEAKTDAIKSSKRQEELIEEALKAMRRYSGFDQEEEDEYYYE